MSAAGYAEPAATLPLGHVAIGPGGFSEGYPSFGTVTTRPHTSGAFWRHISPIRTFSGSWVVSASATLTSHLWLISCSYVTYNMHLGILSWVRLGSQERILGGHPEEWR